MTLNWGKPKQDGGSKVTGYKVLMKEDDKEWQEIAKLKSVDDEYKAKDLKPGRKYSFAVVAENKVGESEAAETVNPVEMKKMATKPGPPEGPIVFSDIKKTSVVIEWKPSLEDGGAKITGNNTVEQRSLVITQ